MLRHSALFIIHFSLALCALNALNAQSAQNAKSAPELSFLVIGDWGVRPTSKNAAHQHAVARQMGATAAKINSRFVLTVGDNFQSSEGVPSADSPLWKSVFEDVYAAPSLQTPWYPALGNHDYDGEPQAQIDYTKRSKRWRLNAPYYTWTETVDADTTVQFFVLDSTPLIEKYASGSRFEKRGRSRPDPRVQIAWLSRALAASKAKWKIVAAHHPVYSGGPMHGDNADIKKHIQPLLHKHGVQIYLGGHVHNFQHLKKDNFPVNYFVIGSGALLRPAGKHRYEKFAQGNTPGFAAITVKRDTIEVRFVDATGKVFYKTEVP